MIEAIWLKYYQSHLDTYIELHPNTTAITGMSMDGKTAILRAFEHLRTNRPLGVRRVYRYAEEPMEIGLKVDGHIVSLRKSSKALDLDGNKSIYSITYPNGRVREFKTVAIDVPKPVSDLINVSDISIQKQLDAYLLVTSSAGEIAKTINKITGLDEGEDWSRQITKIINELGKEKNIIAAQIKVKEEEIKRYDGVELLREDILNLKAMQVEWEQRTKELSDIMDSINTIEGSALELSEADAKLGSISGLASEYDKLLKEISTCQEYIRLANSLSVAREKLAKAEEDLAIILELPSLEGITGEIEECKGILALVRQHGSLAERLSGLNRDRGAAIGEYADKLVEIGKCPVCSGMITDRAHIIKELSKDI